MKKRDFEASRPPRMSRATLRALALLCGAFLAFAGLIGGLYAWEEWRAHRAFAPGAVVINPHPR